MGMLMNYCKHGNLTHFIQSDAHQPVRLDLYRVVLVHLHPFMLNNKYAKISTVEIYPPTEYRIQVGFEILYQILD